MEITESLISNQDESFDMLSSDESKQEPNSTIQDKTQKLTQLLHQFEESRIELEKKSIDIIHSLRELIKKNKV